MIQEEVIALYKDGERQGEKKEIERVKNKANLDVCRQCIEKEVKGCCSPIRCKLANRSVALLTSCPKNLWTCDSIEDISQEDKDEQNKEVTEFGIEVINSTNGSVKTIPVNKVQVYFFDCHGQKMLFDCSSLELAKIAEDIYATAKEDPSILNDIGYIPGRRKPQFMPSLSPKVKKVVINVTHSCNLACRYCFVRNYYEDQVTTIDPDVAYKALIDMFGKEEQIQTGFFGGEPLLVFSTVRSIVRLVEHENKRRGFDRTRFSVTTNATRISKYVADFLKNHNFSMIVSLDGDETTHNEMRPFKDTTHNSYRETMGGLKVLRDSGYPMQRITLRSTFTGSGVDLVGRLDFLNTLVAKGLAGHCSVEPACLTESACLEVDEYLRSFDRDRMEAEFAHEYHQAAIWYVDQIKEGKKPHFHQIDKILQRVYYGIHSATECGGGKGYFGVSPDGTITACHREHGSKIGHINYGIDEELRAKWLDNRLYARNKCPKCPIRYICGGGCRMDSIVLVNDIRTPPDVVCWFKMTWFKECAWILSQLTKQQVENHVKHPNKKGKKRDEPGRTRRPTLKTG